MSLRKKSYCIEGLISSLFIETESFLVMLTLQNSEHAHKKRDNWFHYLYKKKNQKKPQTTPSFHYRLSKRTLQMNYTWNALRRGHWMRFVGFTIRESIYKVFQMAMILLATRELKNVYQNIELHPPWALDMKTRWMQTRQSYERKNSSLTKMFTLC